jgi:endonuclease/exonuclease/phosphatase family metal-dependent hydrolase
MQIGNKPERIKCRLKVIFMTNSGMLTAVEETHARSFRTNGKAHDRASGDESMPLSTIVKRRPADTDTVRALTLNIYGQSADWPARRQVLIDGIRELSPDLIALQETIRTDDYDQIVDLVGAAYHILHSQERAPNGMGISIASRWPLGKVCELDLHLTPRTADFPCTTLMVEVQAPQPFGSVLLVNHFPNWQLDYEYEREVQTVLAARHIEELVAQRDRHIVLVGDLDAEPDAASIRFLAGKQSLDRMSVCYRNAWDSRHPDEAGHTFTMQNPRVAEANWDWPFQRIDHIFVRCGRHGGPTLRIAACELAFNEPITGIWASDHFGLVADLIVPQDSTERQT